VRRDGRLTSCSSTETNARDSLLLRLPAELRNRIYSYVFNAARFNLCGTTGYTDYYFPQHHYLITRYEANARCGIPSTCRQLYAETTISSRRSVIHEFFHPAGFAAWAKTLPPHIRAHVKEIFYHVNCALFREGLLCYTETTCKLDELLEACGLLQGLECVQFAIQDSPHLLEADYTAAIENLKAKPTKEDGRKVKVVLGYAGGQTTFWLPYLRLRNLVTWRRCA
jgi:hypothetical protein